MVNYGEELNIPTNHLFVSLSTPLDNNVVRQ